ncbi:MAG: hypothetical protein LBF38_09375, partial [Deltaproteobacteria bacterium]|nr:hypothetical protein [Deltaproteobacteria bacterium]
MPRLDDARLSPLGTPFRRPFLTGDDFAPVRKPKAVLSKPVETRLDGPTKDRALGQAQAAPAQAAWRAKIALTLGVDKSLETGQDLGRSRIKKLSFEGPLRVQKLFYPEKPAPGEVETCHLYLLHPPGGLVSGDL